MSQLFEYIALASCFFQCCMLLLLDPYHPDPETARAAFHWSIMLHLVSLLTLYMNARQRGTRVHLYPLLSGVAVYSLAFFFGIYEEITFYYYYLTVLCSLVVSLFFGSTSYYESFEMAGSTYEVGCTTVQMKAGGQNRVTIYYPASKDDKNTYPDERWAQDGDHTIRGLMKFGADILPEGLFRHLRDVRQNVKVKAKAAKVEKAVPIILTHGIGNTMSFFSTICKALASQGHILFSLEH